MCKISVIIPLYNKEKYCREAIESVLSQTHANFELIIVNDGSTDKSKEVACLALNGDPRAYIINQNNKGVSEARNVGGEKAKYEYLAFLDADDLWHPRYLDVMSETIRENPDCDWFGCGYKRFIGNLLVTHEYITPKFEELDYFQGNTDSKFQKSGSISMINSDSFLISKSLFKKVNGFPSKMKNYEDIFLFCEIAKLTKLVWSPVEMTFYRMDAQNKATFTSEAMNFPSFILNRLMDETRIINRWEFEYYVKIAMIWVWTTVEKSGDNNALPLKLMLLSLKTKKKKFKVMFKYIPIAFLFKINTKFAKWYLHFTSSKSANDAISVTESFKRFKLNKD